MSAEQKRTEGPVLVADGVMDRYFEEALKVVEHSDYDKLCPIPWQEKVYKCLLYFNAAQWDFMKAQRREMQAREQGRIHTRREDPEDAGDAGEGMSMKVLRGLFSLEHIPTSKAVVVVKMGMKFGLYAMGIFLVYKVWINGSSLQDLKKNSAEWRGYAAKEMVREVQQEARDHFVPAEERRQK